ncbi:MAG: VanW family protein [Saprospiraceae bacterium]|nr:VanW family protein [Saprospiraceae bacterium]
MNYKTLIPKPLKLLVRFSQRQLRDYSSGHARLIAKPGAMPEFNQRVTVQQPIMPSAFFENKVFNMQKAGDRINQILIMPDQIFSFWAAVGYPGRLQGYKIGRNLVGGKIQGAYGGGLCQVSSIIYYLALGAGLEILERHHHSVDIYKENERFTPLGADATVVYGYKDFRFRNSTAQPLCIVLEVDSNQISASLHSPFPLIYVEPEFERADAATHRTVQTKVLGRLVATSTYQVP